MKAENCIQLLFKNCCFWKKQNKVPAPLTEVDIFKDYQFQHLENQTIQQHKFRGESLRISDLKNCTLQILQNLGNIVVQAALDSFLLLGPAKGKARFSDCKGLTVYLWTDQILVENCSDCYFYLHCQKTGEIIDCQNVIIENMRIPMPKQIIGLMVRAKLNPFRSIIIQRTQVIEENFSEHVNKSKFLRAGQITLPLYTNIITKGSKFYYSKRTQDEKLLLTQIEELSRVKIQFFYECRVNLVEKQVRAVVAIVQGTLNSPWFPVPESLQNQLRAQICDDQDQK